MWHIYAFQKTIKKSESKMKQYPNLTRLLVCVSASLPLSTLAAEGGFIEDTTATLQARNYYFSRDFSDIEGPNQQSKAEEWAQGFILRVNSGYTQGTVGFGVDLLGMLALNSTVAARG